MSERRRRDIRRPNPKPISLQPRDIDLVEAVHRHRIMSQAQLTRLFFTSATPARDRLESLFDHHFLERLLLPVYEGEGRSPTLYLLGRRGAELLRAERGYKELRWYSGSRHLMPDKLEHSLAINEVFLASFFACKKNGYECREWKTESELKGDYDYVTILTTSNKREKVAVIPDSRGLVVFNGQGYSLLLELDRGTMPLRRFKNKVKAYVEYYLSGGYEKRYNLKGIRVLTVVSTRAKSGGERRMQDLKEATEEIIKDVPKTNFFWFTTLSQLTPETMFTAPIWYQVGHNETQILIPPA